ncbi:MAG: monovalent cation/H(+) antiporter subunit G [Verrucomicrobiae bacterium]|nr:monovalent cation/H(+) antiporter subunit G [Verrucomicrobiae bacterium]
MVFTIIAALLILAGLVFFFGAAVGLLRFPDFYARMHAAGKGDTLSSLLVIAGFAVYQIGGVHDLSHDWPLLLVVLKLLAIVVFIYLTSPTSTSALADAGWEDGIDPIIEPGRENHLEDDLRPPQP